MTAPEEDPAAFNRRAWDAQVRRGNRWTVPVDGPVIEAARTGTWEIVLTPTVPVPRGWFPDAAGCRTLLLAGGGGQQAPVLAAAGFTVTTLDNAPAQLERDREMAEAHDLSIETVLGDMRDLRAFADGSFDLIVHPCSNTFIPDPTPVWQECHRVLAPGGRLMAGFVQPAFWIFDDVEAGKGNLVVRHGVPYSDLTDITDEERAAYAAKDEPLCFGHDFGRLLGAQCAAGFAIVDVFEDSMGGHALDAHLKVTMATLATRA